MGKKNNEVTVKFYTETSQMRSDLKKVEKELATNRAELKLNATQMKGNANDTDLLKTRQSLLATELQKSKEKVELTNVALQKAREIYGEDSLEVQTYEKKLADAKNQEQSIKNEIEQVNVAIQNQVKSNEEVNSSYDTVSKKIADEEVKLEALKREYVNVILEQGRNSTSAKALENDIQALNKELSEDKIKLSEAENAADKLTDSLDDVGNSANSASSGGFTVFKGILSDLASNAISNCIEGLKGFGASVLETGMSFEAEMSKVGSVAGATKEEMNTLKDTAKEMGASTKFTATESAEAMEYMGMAGWKAEQMVDGLPGILNLAAASGEELGKTSDIVTDGLTAFGMKAEEAGHFADVMAAASASANTNVSLLGESFSYAAPLAGALKYNVEDTSIALGLMANAGIKGSRGGTALKNTLTNLAKPTDSIQAAMDQLGISLTNTDGSTKSLMEIMNDLRDAFGQGNISTEDYCERLERLDELNTSGQMSQKDYNEAVEELNELAFGSVDAMNAKNAATIAGKEGMAGLLAIVNASDEDYKKLTDAVYSATDAESGYSAATEMAQNNMDNLQGDVTIMQSAFEGLKLHIEEDADGPLRGLAQDVTEKVIPGLTDMYDGIKNGAQWIGEHKTLIEGLGVGVGALTAGIAAYNIVAGIKAAMDKAQTTSLLGLASAQLASNAAFLASPITWIVAGIVGLIAGIVLLWNNCEGFRDFVTGTWDGITNIFGTGVEKVKTGLSSMGDKISSVKETCGNALDGIKEKARTKLDETKGIYEEAGGGIAGVAAVGMNLVKSKYQSAYDDINTLTGGRLDGLKEVTMNKLSGLKTVYEQNGGGIKGIIAAGMSAQKEIYSTGYDAINQLTGGKLDKLKNKAKDTIDGAAGFFKTGIDKIKGLLDFEFKWPHVKVPSIGVTWNKEGTLAKAAQILGLAGMPKFDVTWNANGAIFTKPMIAGWYNGSWQGVGEAGAEAVLPIERLEDMIGNRMESFLENMPSIDYRRLAEAIVEADEGREIVMVWNDREMGRAIRRVMA